MGMSVTMSLYSSSPPSSTFASTTGFQPSSSNQPRVGADIDFHVRSPAAQQGKGPVKGGLTSLFAGQKSAKVVNLSSSVDSIETSTHLKRSSGGDYGSVGRESLLGRSLPLSIPPNSRGKSPVSVLFGGSPVASLVSHEGSEGLPPLDRTHQPRRTSKASADARRRSQVGRDPLEETVVLSRRALEDVVDSPPDFSLRAGLLDITLDLDISDEEALASPSAQSLPPYLSSATLQRQTTIGRSFGLDSPDVRPQHTSFSSYSARVDTELQFPRKTRKLTADELLLKAQEMHDVFRDELVQHAFRIAAGAHEGRVS